MTIKNALKKAYRQLNNSLTPQLDAEVLLVWLLKKDRSWLFSHDDDELTEETEKKFQILIDRRKKHEPVAYIIGQQSFYGRIFAVNSNVLIPRPVSEEIIDLLKKDFHPQTKLSMIDVGTGSGCLAITAALFFPNALVYGLDISPQALQVAKTNKKRLGVANLRLHQTDLLNYFTDRGMRADVIFANLPYLTKKDLNNSSTKEALAYEPINALLTDDQLSLIKNCTLQAGKILKTKGKLYLEMLPSQIPIFIQWVKNQRLPFSIKHTEWIISLTKKTQ